jgi:hypothetical protein
LLGSRVLELVHCGSDDLQRVLPSASSSSCCAAAVYVWVKLSELLLVSAAEAHALMPARSVELRLAADVSFHNGQRCSMSTLALAITFFALGQLAPDIQTLVDRQQTSEGLLWAVEMDIDFYFSSVGKGPIDPPLHMYHEHWARDPLRERQHYRRLVEPLTNRQGQAIGISDMLDNGNSRRLVENWDYAANGTKIPDGPNAVRAKLLQRSRDVPSVFPSYIGGFYFQTAQGPSLSIVSISEFLRDSPRVTLGEVDSMGRREIVALHPDDVTAGPGKGRVTHLFFDPRHGGLVSRNIVTAPPNEWATAPTTWESEVTKWSEPRPGVFVPVEVRSRHVAPKYDNGQDKLLSEARMVASNIRVNDEVPESAFVMPFPENSIVHDYSDPKKPQYHLWGADDKPAATSEDVLSLPVPLGLDSSRSAGFWRVWMAPAGFGALLVVLVGAWYYRRRASK